MPTKFKLARVMSGKKQIELSFETRIPVSMLSQIECGWRIPNSDQVKKLSEALGVKPEEIFPVEVK